MKRILAISGSTRKNSTNWKIIEQVSGLFRDRVIVEIYEDLNRLPHFDPSGKDSELPDIVKGFLAKIDQADGVLISTPEYVFSLPSVLKNALEWTVAETVLSYKPAAFIVASSSGKMAFESLDLILKTLLQQPVPEEAKLLIQGAKGKVDENGRIEDKDILSQIRGVVNSLIQFMEKVSSTQGYVKS